MALSENRVTPNIDCSRITVPMKNLPNLGGGTMAKSHGFHSYVRVYWRVII